MINPKDLALVIDEFTPGALITNVIKIKDFVEERIKDYTPEQYIGMADMAKLDRAELNNAAKTLNAKRIELEKEFMRPFVDVKTLITTTVKTIEGAAAKLDEIVKEEESREKAAKREEIEIYFAGKAFILAPLDKIFDQRWLNKGIKAKEWQADIDAKIDKIYADIKIIERLQNDAEVIKSVYLTTLSIDAALKQADALEENRKVLQKEKEARANREADAELKKAEQTLEAEIINDWKDQATAATIAAATGAEIEESDPFIFLELRVSGNKSAIYRLKEWMLKNGIQYEKL